jgi:hypothetical protein
MEMKKILLMALIFRCFKKFKAFCEELKSRAGKNKRDSRFHSLRIYEYVQVQRDSLNPEYTFGIPPESWVQD